MLMTLSCSQKNTQLTRFSVRQHTNGNSPVTDLTSTDLRCNKDALDGSSTGTIDVNAGDEVSFQLDTAVYHQGPTSL
jgi:hypothetical protein